MTRATGRRRLVPISVALAIALGSFGSMSPAPLGGLQSNAPIGNGLGASASRPSVVRTGSRPVAHHAGGIPLIPARGVALPSPRLSRTGFVGIEPSLGVDPSGRVFVSAGLDNGVLLTSVVLRSTDQGATWNNVTPGPVNLHTYSEDPYLYVDPSTGRLFHDDLILPCQMLSRSDDAGASWKHSVVACEQADHQTLFAGPPSTAKPKGYPNVVYDCAIGGGALSPSSTMTTCGRSLDGGRTFTPVIPPYPPRRGPRTYGVLPGYCDGATGHGFVGPDGTVYVPRGWCGQPWLAMSRDEGLSWTRTQVAANGMPVDASGGFDHEAGAVADAAGNVYYFWIARDRLPYLAISRDHGSTWSEPMMVGPPGLRESSLPAIAIGAPGKLAMAYMGSTNSPGPPFPRNCPPRQILTIVGDCPDPANYADTTWDGYLTITADALATNPTFGSATVNDPADPFIRGTCGPIRCKAEFDFIAVQVAPDGTPWSAFVDACLPGKVCTPSGELVVGHLVGGPGLR